MSGEAVTVPLTERLAAWRDRVAVVDPAGTWTFGHLEDAARSLAAVLRRGRADLDDDRVAILCTPGHDFVIALLACWHAGAIAVPLHPPHPDAELRYVVDDADADAIVASRMHRAAAERLAGAGRRRVVDVEARAGADGRSGAAPSRPALMIHTSGTTGRPKGVVHTHASIAAQIDGMLDAWAWTPEDRVVLVLPLNHVHGVVNVVCCALAAGACCEAPGAFDPIHVWERLCRTDPAAAGGVSEPAQGASELGGRAERAPAWTDGAAAGGVSEPAQGASELGGRAERALAWTDGAAAGGVSEPAQGASELGRRAERAPAWTVTVLMAVPTIYARLVAAWEAADDATRSRWSAGARQLRLMVSGSAALPVSTLARWRELTGHVLLERYGMTELGMVLSNTLTRRVPGHVGEPMPGVEVRIVDDEGRDAGDGPGELLVRGPNVFAGYWRRPEATAEAFVDGWFRTGDVAVRDADGYRLLGRSSVDIIKSGGEKVSALEIEEVFRTHPAVVDCAVVGVEDPEWGQRVAIAVVPTAGAEPTAESLRAWGKEQLAPAKVPSRFRFLEHLPRNTLGKVVKADVSTLFSSDRPD